MITLELGAAAEADEGKFVDTDVNRAGNIDHRFFQVVTFRSMDFSITTHSEIRT